jgi:hypothetical protein
MAQKKETTRKFKSISTGQECNAAQYVAELVCMRKREKENSGSLEYKFWNKSQNEQYNVQVRAASKLIKKFGEKALLKYLNSPSGKNIYSLGFLHKSKKFVLIVHFVEDGVSKCAEQIKKKDKSEKKVIKPPSNPEYKTKKPKKQNTLFSKIRNIENGKD